MDEAAERAFGEYVAARLPALLRLAHLLTGDRVEAEDLVQTALVKTYRAWPRVRSRDDPDAYVRRALVNARNSWWRRGPGRRETLTDAVPDPHTACTATAAATATTAAGSGYDERDAMWRALATLPRRQRAVLVLRYYEDLTEAEIAAVLGVAPGTVKSQAAKGLRKLREAPGLRVPEEVR